MSPTRSRDRRSWLLATLALLAPSSASSEAPVGTWHVLIHYQRVDAPDPERWLWDERVWVIEPIAGGGLAWTEHAIVSLRDPTGRFEHLGTNRARRLVGAWEPSPAQAAELETGVSVSSRGVRSKHLAPLEPGRWASDSAANAIGLSAGGVGYHERWSLGVVDGLPRFEIDGRFELQGGSESAGRTTYEASAAQGEGWTGRYRVAGERRGVFRMRATRILIVADDRDDPTRRPQAATPQAIELVPDRTVHSDVPLFVTVLRPFHYYSDRAIAIDSTPAGAEVDLAYLRRGSQLLYRRGRAPLTVSLPTRLQTDSADRLLVRGFVPGYERYRHSFDALDAPEHLHLDFAPLANQLTGVAHGHLAGQTVIELVTSEEPQVRISRDERGFTLVLLRTGLADAHAALLASYPDPVLALQARQLGEDLVLWLASPEAADLELRQEILQDPARGEFRTRLRIASRDASERVAELRQALSSLESASPGCALAFEGALRRDLDDAALLESLGRGDHPERVTLRAALRRLAELAPDGLLRLSSGASLRASTPLEFELLWTRRTEVQGYLAWLSQLTRRLEPEDGGASALRGLVAPSWDAGTFGATFERARRDQQRCRARAVGGGASPGSGMVGPARFELATS